MKNKKSIEYLITKFLNKEASKKELSILDTKFKKTKNVEIFNAFVKTNFLSNTLMENFDVEQAKINVKKKIKKKRSTSSIFYLKIAAIAAAVAMFGVFIFKGLNRFATNKSEIVKKIEPGTDKAVLTLEDGKKLILEKNKKIDLQNSKIKGKKIVYSSNKVAKKKDIVYNYLAIPRGGQYFLVLSDGTKVWLNSESKIKYPVKFADNSIREITLLYGEAYFEVSPSTKHKGTKFKINSKHQSIIVHGTKFNIKSYRETNKTYTTLVEGSISITHKHTTKILTPGTQAIVTKNNIKLKENIDVIYETSWKNGVFIFYKEKLDTMLISLSRWYNVAIEYENENKKNEVFSGVLKRTDNIEDLLSLLQKTGAVSFKVEQNKIIVK